MSGMTVKSDFPAFPFHLCPPHDLFYYYTPVLSFSSLALLCWLQAALRDSTGTAAASRVHSVPTALGHATMSQVNVSACLASLAPCVTKASSLLCHFDLLSCCFIYYRNHSLWNFSLLYLKMAKFVSQVLWKSWLTESHVKIIPTMTQQVNLIVNCPFLLVDNSQ